MKRAAIIAAVGVFLAATCLLVGFGCSRDSATGSNAFSSYQAVVGDFDFTDGYPWGVWQDDFEAYATGSFPSAWIADGNALTVGGITDALFYEGTRCLYLYGVPYSCWSGEAYRALEVQAPFEIRVAVAVGDEDIGLPCTNRGAIGLLAGSGWEDPERILLYFDPEDQIMANGEVLGNYNPGEFYHIRIRYERPSETEVRMRYWINNQCVAGHTRPVYANEDNWTHLELLVRQGSAWFDAVEICSRPE